MKFSSKILCLVLMIGVSSCTKPTLKDLRVSSESDKNLYALGARFGSGLKTMDLTEDEAILIARGLFDASRGDILDGIQTEERGQKLQAFLIARREEVIERTRQKGEQFLEEFVQSGATKTPSGLAYKVTKTGGGPSPEKNGMVVVNYKATLIDGTVYAGNDEKNGPSMISLTQMITGWAEGMMMMKAGGKMKLVIPPELAFGNNGSPPDVPGGSTVIIDVELVAVPMGLPDRLKKPPGN